MKFFHSLTLAKVAPYVGAWIETQTNLRSRNVVNVAPYVGAWIETIAKLFLRLARLVAPYVGAWIETGGIATLGSKLFGRTLCGCVD